MIRACRIEDHIYVLFQLLRLPSKLLKPLYGLIQPPIPSTECFQPFKSNCADFIYQPEVELILSLFALCLKPVRCVFANYFH